MSQSQESRVVCVVIFLDWVNCDTQLLLSISYAKETETRTVNVG